MASQSSVPESPDRAGQPQLGFSRQWLLIALCTAVGLALSVVLFLVMTQREARLAEARFHLDAERQADRVHGAVSDIVAGVGVLRGFFAGSQLVEPDEFRVFTQPLVEATPEVLAFGWAPGGIGDDGKESFPTLFLSGKGSSPVEAGWNLASVPECREAVDRARASGGLASSAPFALDGIDLPVVLLAVAEENDNREGCLFALFAPADVLRSAVWPHLAEMMDISVFDRQQPGTPVLLAEHDGGEGQLHGWLRLSTFELAPYEHPLAIGGREWLIECRPTATLVAVRRSWLPYGSVAAGILLTAAGVGILALLAVQTLRVERLVAARTTELKQSEERLRTITGTALDAVVMMAPDGTVAHWNPAAERMFGYRHSEIMGHDVHEMLVPEEYREQAVRGVRRFVETGQGEVVGKLLEFDALRKDGTRFPIEISIAAIRMDGRWGAVAIVRDITRRRAAEEAIQKEQALLRRLLEFHERERKLMAYEIHDGLVQQLTGAHMTLQSFPQAPGGDDTSARDRFEAVDGLLRDAIAEARRIISGLRPPILDELGVEPAVAYLVDQQRRRGGQQIELVSELGGKRFSSLVETAVFRIVQEGLNNACRYSRSERIRVELRTDGERLHVEVRDWGEGFDPERVGAGHFGIEGIRERARLLEGNAEVQSAPGDGTIIHVTLPARQPGEGEWGEFGEADDFDQSARPARDA